MKPNRLDRIVNRCCRVLLGAGMSAVAFVVEKQVERFTAKELDGGPKVRPPGS
jgi:hypothetical protein